MSSKIFCLFLFFSSPFYHTFCYAQEQPIPDWVKDIGGTGESKLAGIGVDKNDNVYVAGNFQNTLTVDNSGISTPINLSSNGSYDIYIAKYTPDGKLLWAKSIGGNGLDQVNNLAVDKDGNVIIGASFSSSSIDCDPGSGTSTITSNGGEDALVVKLSTDGNFVWARSVGGSSTDRGHVVTTDKDGNVIFVGSFSSGSVNISGNTLTNRGNYDGFVAKFAPTGITLWSVGFGSSGMDEIKSVKTDSNGAIAIMGYFGANINLNPRGTANNFTATGETYFIAKYTSNGMLDWANKIDGSSKTVASISIGPTNDIFATGVFSGSINFNSANLISLTASGGVNLFIAQYNNSGRAMWAKRISSTASNPYAYYITVDNENSAYIGGFFDLTLTFNPDASPRVLTYHGGRDTFFAKYNGNGDYQWAFNFGSACTGNFGHKIDVDSKKNVLLGGAFCRTVDFNPGNCNLSLTAKHGTSDGYIAKFNQIKLTGEPLITEFELDEQTAAAVIDPINKKITISVNAGTDLTRLKPRIETDIGVLSPLSEIETNFSVPKTYKITSNCIDSFWEVTVSSQNLPVLTTCSGDSRLINGDASRTGTYQWELSDNGGWINAPNSATLVNYEADNFTNSSNNVIQLTFRRKVNNNNAIVYDSYTILVVYPAVSNNSISPNANTICIGSDVTITGSTAIAAQQQTITYQWQKSADNVSWANISNATSRDYTATPISQPTFFRRVASSSICHSQSNTIKIEISTSPTANITGNVSGCSTVILTATGGTTYQWSGGNTPNQATNTFTISGTYSVIVTNAEGCSTTVSKTITIGAGQTDISGNINGCNTVTLTASGGATYQWDGGSTPNQATNTFSTSGTYNVIITDANGCVSSQQRIVTVTPSVSSSISIAASTTNICRGSLIRFMPTYANAGSSPTFKWFRNGTQVAISQIYTTTSLQNNDEISCEIIGSNTCSLPAASNKIQITVNDLPTVSFESDIIIESDGPKVLSPQVSASAISYSWFPITGLDNPRIKNPQANPEFTTEYTLTVTGSGGCSAEATIKVTVLKDIFIPNVFSPNGDGKNDQWVIRNISDYVGTKVQIFNRYGQKVFQNDNFTTPWDGILSGKPLPVGNYYYILDLANKSKTRYKGSVTILR